MISSSFRQCDYAIVVNVRWLRLFIIDLLTTKPEHTFAYNLWISESPKSSFQMCLYFHIEYIVYIIIYEHIYIHQTQTPFGSICKFRVTQTAVRHCRIFSVRSAFLLFRAWFFGVFFFSLFWYLLRFISICFPVLCTSISCISILLFYFLRSALLLLLFLSL